MKTKTSKKKKLENQLKSYATIVASVVAADASSQVVYTNIQDTSLVNNGDFFDIDFNNDGINDVTINLTNSQYSTTFSSISIYVNLKSASMSGATSNEVNASFTSGTSSSVSVYEVAALNNNQVINNLNSWYSYGYLGGDATIQIGTQTSSIAIGQFPGQGQKFAGVRFFIGNNLHYGWVRLDMSASSDTVTIFDFAYDTTANAAILAGDTGLAVGIGEVNTQLVDYYATEAELRFPKRLEESTEVLVYDLKGQLQERGRIPAGSEFYSLKRDYNGIYIVELNTTDGVVRKKLWLDSE